MNEVGTLPTRIASRIIRKTILAMINTLNFTEEVIQRLFGNEAAENESLSRLLDSRSRGVNPPKRGYTKDTLDEPRSGGEDNGTAFEAGPPEAGNVNT